MTVTSFRLLGIGLRSIDIRYGMYSSEERSRANDAGEDTVGYLVIIYYYIITITYRLLAMGLGDAIQVEVLWAPELDCPDTNFYCLNVHYFNLV